MLLPLTAGAALIGRYKMDAASGSQLDSSGVAPAADAFPSGTAHVWQQPGVPGGTYGSINLPAGTVPFAAGFPASVAAASTDHWLVSTAAPPAVTAPVRYNALLNNFTVMGWIHPNTAKTQRIFSTQVSGVTNHSWGFGMTAALKVRFTDYGQYDIDSTPSPVALNTWQHIAATKSSTGGIRLYHNGVLIHTDGARTANITASPNTTTNWRLMNGPNNEVFAGHAAEIRIYDNVLSEQEIRTAAGHLPTPTGNMGNDFSPPNNPYLNFSHGVKASATAAAMTLFTSSLNSTVNKPANRLADGADNLWVGKAPANAGSAVFPAAGGVLTDWLAGTMYHAWSGGRTDYLTSRYTVSSSGWYDLSAVWKSHTQAGCRAQVSVVLNGTSLFTAPIDGFNGTALSGAVPSGPAQTASFSQPGYSLTAGDVLDFVTAPEVTTPSGNLSVDVRVLPVTGPPVSTATPVISEFVASNSRSYADEDGRYGDWIEIYNGSGAAVDLTGWSLTDNAAQPRKWMFPAGRTLAHGQFMVIFADNRDAEERPFYTPASVLHTNFQLSAGGEYLGLVDAAGTVVSAYAPAFPAQITDIAYGLAGSTGPAIGYLTPTPNRVNGSIASAPPGTVAFSVPAGVYTTAQSVNLSVNPAGQTIRYTTNNTEPTLSSGSTFTAGTPLNITTTTVVRARAFVDGVGGPLVEAQYLFTAAGVQPDAADTYRLPVIVIDTLGGGTLGGFGGEAPQKAALVAVFEPGAGGQTSLAAAPAVLSRGGSHVRGQSSATYKKQGFDLEFWDETGRDRSVPLLGMPADGDWALYAPYEFDRVYMNNRLAYEMAARTGRYAPRTRFVELYVNTDGGALTAADYYGIYVVTETPERGADRIDIAALNPSENSPPDVTGGYIVSINKSNEAETVLAASLPFMRHMRQNKSNIILTGGMTTFLDYPEITAVTPAQLSWIDNYLKLTEESIYGANFTHPVTGLPYTDYIARDNWLDFHLAMTIPMCIDALRLSTYFYKEREGKLKCGPVWDYDRGFNSRDSRSAVPTVWDTQTSLDKTEYFHYGWWHRLFQNADFMQAWIDRYAVLRSAGQAFDFAGVVAPVIDGYAAELAPAGSVVNAQTRDYARWPSGAGGSGTGLSSARNPLATEVTALKNWLTARFNFIDGQILRTPAASVPGGVVAPGTGVTFTLTGASGAAQIYVTTDGSDPRLPGGAPNPAAVLVPNGGSITVNSTALVRYRQRDLTAPAFNSDLTTTRMSTWSAPGESYYIVGAVRAAAGMVTVSQMHYHPADPTPAEITAGFTDADNFEFIELQNISSQRVNLEGCRFSAGFDYTFPVASLVELAPGERVLLVKNLAAFTSRYGAASVRVIGEFSGNDNLNNAGETVTLLASDGTTILSFTYDDEPLWPVEADGLGPALVLIAPETNPNLSEPMNWRLSTSAGGAPVTGDRLTYAAWKTASGITGDSDDSDHDGLMPLLEYALGSSTSAMSLAALPIITMQPDGSLLIQLTRALNADDAAWDLQTTSDLATWTILDADVITRTFSGNTESLSLTAPAPAAGTLRRYVRLQVHLRQ